MHIKEGKWKRGNEVITGRWRYNWSSSSFTVWLDKECSVTGSDITLTVYGEKPEWDSWKFMKEGSNP